MFLPYNLIKVVAPKFIISSLDYISGFKTNFDLIQQDFFDI